MIRQLLFKKVLLLSAVVLLGKISTVFAQNAVKDSDPINDIMFQSFGWDEYDQSRVACGFYNFYDGQASYLSEAGIDMVWFPPASVSTGGVGYIPTKLFDFSSTSWGSESDLTAMLATYNELGMYPIADIVVNHRGGTTGWIDFTEPTWDCSAVTSGDEAATDPQNTGEKPCGNADTGTDFPGGRDLDHTNSQVQEGVKEFLSKLKVLGFKGWRWDVAKGFSPSYFGDYNDASSPYYSVGEYWDGNANNLKNWVDGARKTSGAFDFSNYYQLSSAVKNKNYTVLDSGGKMPGLAGYEGYDGLSVTFVDNHDTFTSDDSHVDDANVMQAYAYILTHPGIPCVWAAHYYGGSYSKDDRTRTYTDHQNEINILMAVRKQNGINGYSAIDIKQAFGTYEAHVSPTYGTPASVIVKLGADLSSPTGDWIENASGAGYKVWSKKQVSTPEKAAECSVSIGIVGEGISDWTTDIEMQSTDGVTYTLTDYQFAGGGVKFRANKEWVLDWGGAGFPEAIAVKKGSDNIIVPAGKYTVTFNIQTLAYSFVSSCICPDVILPVCANGVEYQNYCYAECSDITEYTTGSCGTSIGIIGSAVNGWEADDVDMQSTDGVNYTLSYFLKAGEFKFRKDNKWTENWGATGFPGGTGTLDGANIPIVDEGNYDITFNTTTLDYNLKYLSVTKFDYNPNNITFNVYPNPSEGDWKVSSEEVIESIQIRDVSGKIMANYSPNTLLFNLPSNGLTKGLYFAIVKTQSATKTIKLLKK